MLSRVLRNLRIDANLTQDELAQKLGVAKSTISMYENGNRIPNLAQLQKLANFYKVDMNYLTGNEASLPGNMYPAEENIVMVPKLGFVAAGLGCLAENEVVGYEGFAASSIKRGHEYMCLEVKGDSMYPLLIPGDTVLVQVQRTVDSGKIAVVTVDGDEGVIKKVIYGSNWIELHSINPMYPIRRFENEEVQKINVMGLVVESKRKF